MNRTRIQGAVFLVIGIFLILLVSGCTCQPRWAELEGEIPSMESGMLGGTGPSNQAKVICRSSCDLDYEVTRYKLEEIERTVIAGTGEQALYSVTYKCFCDLNECKP